MTNCDSIQDRLSQYLDQSLSAADRLMIDQHFLGCPACQKYLRELKQMQQLLQAQPLRQPPDSFYAGVHARIESREKKGAFSWNVPMKVISAFCLLMIAIVVMRQYPTARHADNEFSERKRDRLSELDEARSPVAAKTMTTSDAPALKENVFKKDIVRQLQDVSPTAPAAQLAPTLQGNKMRSQAAAVDMVSEEKSSDASLAIGRRANGSFSDNGAAAVHKTASIVADASARVIRDADSWQTLWRQFLSAQKSPTVDFKTSIVLIVERVRADQGVAILRVQTSPAAVTVFYTVALNLPANAPHIPFDYKVIPKTDLPISFQPALQ